MLSKQAWATLRDQKTKLTGQVATPNFNLLYGYINWSILFSKPSTYPTSCTEPESSAIARNLLYFIKRTLASTLCRLFTFLDSSVLISASIFECETWWGSSCEAASSHAAFFSMLKFQIDLANIRSWPWLLISCGESWDLRSWLFSVRPRNEKLGAMVGFELKGGLLASTFCLYLSHSWLRLPTFHFCTGIWNPWCYLWPKGAPWSKVAHLL